jgi:Flp pilus assembly protein TadD
MLFALLYLALAQAPAAAAEKPAPTASANAAQIQAGLDLVAKGNAHAAVVELGDLAQSAPHDPAVLLALAQAQEADEDLEQAKKTLAQLVAAAPDDAAGQV